MTGPRDGRGSDSSRPVRSGPEVHGTPAPAGPADPVSGSTQTMRDTETRPMAWSEIRRPAASAHARLQGRARGSGPSRSLGHVSVTGMSRSRPPPHLTFARPTRARPPRGPRSRRPAPLCTAATRRGRRSALPCFGTVAVLFYASVSANEVRRRFLLRIAAMHGPDREIPSR